ncbi:hypothetical protein OH77DRAFT_1418960 [Trametes cingulata]|nr:hypothetical protein OH77DRAFT_1418960 [Trametes cingulata]
MHTIAAEEHSNVEPAQLKDENLRLEEGATLPNDQNSGVATLPEVPKLTKRDLRIIATDCTYPRLGVYQIVGIDEEVTEAIEKEFGFKEGRDSVTTIVDDPVKAGRILWHVLQPMRVGMIRPPLKPKYNEEPYLVELCRCNEILREEMRDGVVVKKFTHLRQLAIWYKGWPDSFPDF